MNSELWSIRRMAEADIPDLLEIERASFKAPWSDSMFRSQLNLGEIAINHVLEIDGSLGGYIAAWIAFDEIHILSIAVTPRQRRKGYAKKILEAAIERGRSMGGKRVVLEVRAGNVAARNFYGKFGFKIIGERKRYYSETREDAVVMELDLDQ